MIKGTLRQAGQNIRVHIKRHSPFSFSRSGESLRERHSPEGKVPIAITRDEAIKVYFNMPSGYFILNGKKCFPAILLGLTVCILFFSCAQDKSQVDIPQNVLPKEKMTQVIMDIHIAEAEISLNSPPALPAGQLDSTRETINFRKIFEKDSITKQQYEESLNFYIDHPQLLDSIYVQVLNELSKMQSAK